MKDRLFRICEEGFGKGDFEYFMRNVQECDYAECYRTAVNWDNYDICDLIISKGYRVITDDRIIADVMYYVDREMYEKIEYIVKCGFDLNSRMMVKIVNEINAYSYFHTDDAFLEKVFELCEEVWDAV